MNEALPQANPLPETPLRGTMRSLETLEKTTKSGKVMHPVEIQLLEFASVRLAAIPGEPFVQTGMYLKKRYGSQLVPVGYANGSIGYIPTREAFSRGGYEVVHAPSYYGIKVPSDLEQRIREGISELAEHGASKLGDKLHRNLGKQPTVPRDVPASPGSPGQPFPYPPGAP